MSARRPVSGIATADPSRVAVTTHDALAGEVCSSPGSAPWIGMTSDCMSAPQRLPNARTATISPACRTGGRSVAGEWVDGMALLGYVTYTNGCVCYMHLARGRAEGTTCRTRQGGARR